MPKQPTMPRTVRICGRRIGLKVEYSRLNMTARGVWSGDTNEITLDANCAPDERRAVAVHEILHDIDQVCGAGLSEQTVASVASVLFAVIRDNPRLVAWLQHKG